MAAYCFGHALLHWLLLTFTHSHLSQVYAAQYMSKTGYKRHSYPLSTHSKKPILKVSIPFLFTSFSNHTTPDINVIFPGFLLRDNIHLYLSLATSVCYWFSFCHTFTCFENSDHLHFTPKDRSQKLTSCRD